MPGIELQEVQVKARESSYKLEDVGFACSRVTSLDGDEWVLDWTAGIFEAAETSASRNDVCFVYFPPESGARASTKSPNMGMASCGDTR